jgi:uncharacterized YccA/Bax inhibitor family protein
MDERMTVMGTVNKSMMLLAIVLAGAVYSWGSAFPSGYVVGSMPVVSPWMIGAFIGAAIASLVIIFVKTTAPVLAPVYAALEGLTLGTISAIFEARYPGIALQAVFCTIGVFASLLLAYRSGMIRATENFRRGMAAAMGGICIVYLIDFVMMFFGMRVPFLHENGLVGMGISVVIVGVAALRLVLDFDFIERGAEQGAPKYMEWYASFGLLLTLVWLYLEILRLLAKSRSRD